jgi:methylthioribose-1-phosphate isomerase
VSSPPPGLAPEDILRLEDGAVLMLDQTRLPAEVVTVRLEGWPEVVEAIRGMVVRGAPAIGVAGAMGVALAAARAPAPGLAAVRAEVARAAAALREARPTAVNLPLAVDRQARLADAHPGPARALVADLAAAARRLHADEVERCERMGRHALALLSRGARILTHCNAGALATGGYGTALGVVRAAFAADPGVRVVVDETRPLLQGARLTAWELEREGIPYTLIADSMAAAMMASGRVSHVVVGADRIAANGDVVNKIGTYGVAILAREHGIPMIVAAPTTTLDPSTPSGAGVVIEERAADEVRGLDLFGRAAAPADAGVANPAFDVTPARLVSAIVTEEGVHRPPYERSLRAALDAAAARAPSSVTPS